MVTLIHNVIPQHQASVGVEARAVVNFAFSEQQLKEVLEQTQLCLEAEGAVRPHPVPMGESPTGRLLAGRAPRQGLQVCLLSRTRQMTTEQAAYLEDKTVHTLV